MDEHDTGELVAHLYSAYQIALDYQQRLTQREQARLRKARQRTLAPTTHESDGEARHRLAV